MCSVSGTLRVLADRLGAGAALPPLLLDDEEAIAVAVSLHAAAGGTVTGIEETSLRALTKLRQLLPSRLRHRTDALVAATVSVATRGPTVDADTLTVIAAAIRDSERLRFDYLDHDGTSSRRSAEPHRLVFTGRRWYLLAWDDDRDDWRTSGPTASAPALRTALASPLASPPAAMPPPTWSAAPAPRRGRIRPESGCTRLPRPSPSGCPRPPACSSPMATTPASWRPAPTPRTTWSPSGQPGGRLHRGRPARAPRPAGGPGRPLPGGGRAAGSSGVTVLVGMPGFELGARSAGHCRPVPPHAD
jgi:hypothetical protein